MQNIIIPESHNYIAAFLTMGCNLRCSFCINRFGDQTATYGMIPGKQWIEGLNRIISRPDLPITLQGGEPSLHPDFLEIINGIRPDLNIDILTNLQFDIEEFMSKVRPERISRDAPYASIRVSYHPETMDLQDLKGKVLRLMEKGYSVGIWSVMYPLQMERIEQAKAECTRDGIDFRYKEFLGYHDGKLYGDYKYSDSLSGKMNRPVQCKTTELIIGPTGDIFRCHGDLYSCRPAIGNISNPDFHIEEKYRFCDCYGLCNPCDVKIKTNRFQQYGHTSVDIREQEHGA